MHTPLIPHAITHTIPHPVHTWRKWPREMEEASGESATRRTDAPSSLPRPLGRVHTHTWGGGGAEVRGNGVGQGQEGRRGRGDAHTHTHGSASPVLAWPPPPTHTHLLLLLPRQRLPVRQRCDGERDAAVAVEEGAHVGRDTLTTAA